MHAARTRFCNHSATAAAHSSATRGHLRDGIACATLVHKLALLLVHTRDRGRCGTRIHRHATRRGGVLSIQYWKHTGWLRHPVRLSPGTGEVAPRRLLRQTGYRRISCKQRHHQVHQGRELYLRNISQGNPGRKRMRFFKRVTLP